MKYMIKTHSGEVIEFLSGDIIQVYDYVLLHRPFKNGMNVEIRTPVYEWVERVYDSEKHGSIESNCIRHSNPAWRDHPAYIPEET